MPDRDQESAPSGVKSLQRLTIDRSEEHDSSPPAVERDVVDRVACRAGDDSCATAHASTINRATASQPARALAYSSTGYSRPICRRANSHVPTSM